MLQISPHPQSKQHLENISRLQLYRYRLIGTRTESQTTTSHFSSRNSSNGSAVKRRAGASQSQEVSKDCIVESGLERGLTGEADNGYESSHEDVCNNTHLPHDPVTTANTLHHCCHHDNSYLDNHTCFSGGSTEAMKSNEFSGRGEGEADERKIVGLLAQEVRKILPEAVLETVSLRS